MLNFIDQLTYDEKEQLARNKSSSIEILYKLSSDNNNFIRYFVAKNINTPKEILLKLFKENNTINMYISLIENKNCPEEIIKEIYCKRYLFIDYVVKLIINHPNFPENLKAFI